MFILMTGHQPGVYVPLKALFLVRSVFSHSKKNMIFLSKCEFLQPRKWQYIA